MNQSIFEDIRHINEYGNEYWSARELYKVLEYSEYNKFLPVIENAKISCRNSSETILDHFAKVSEMIKIARGTVRETNRKIQNYNLSRYACYLIIQNADPRKEVVALGQTYFAIQTRKQELTEQFLEDTRRKSLRNEMKKHNTDLAEAAKNAGVVEPVDYAIFQNFGYMGLYNGLDNKGIHKKKGLKKSQKILDHMSSEELAANLFRATQAEAKLKRENIQGKMNANDTHFGVGKEVRQTIEKLGGTMPEELPATESIKKAEKRLKESENLDI
ncbi:MAG: DNA damage-inducible protein D [Candidatus Gracilibacteria bacterium]|nr:DNA damage-inducible protein D [Candidatus Gracilibacteria bacterium]